MKTNRPTNEWIRANAPAAQNALTLVASPADFQIEAEAPAEAGKPPKPRKFSMVAYTGGPMNVGDFFFPVVVDLSGLELGNSPRPILVDHTRDMDHVLGQTEKVEVKGGKLLVTGNVFGESDRVRQVLALNDKGFKFQASIGARVLNREFVPEGSNATVNGRTFSGPLHVARKSVLGEVSFVVLGADDNTSARIAAHAAKGNAMSFEQWLEAKGFAAADLSDAQRDSLKAMYDAEQRSAAAGATGGNGQKPAAGNAAGQSGNGAAVAATQQGAGDLDAILGAERKKAEKREQIVDLTAKALQENPGQLQIIEALSRQAMEGGWEPQRYELELLRATRPQSVHRSRNAADEGLTGTIVEAALCLAGGIEKPESHFSEVALEAAAKRWRHGLGLGELLMLFARRNGHDALSTRNIGPMLRAAFAEPADHRMLLASGVSSLSLPGILSNVANKFLRMGFDSVESTWRAIAAVRPVRDFKQVTSYSLTGDFQYVEVPAGGQLEHATVGEESYTNQAKTYGRMFGIDRRDIINDDLGALTQVPRRLGRGGALKFNEVFWTAFMDNASFFTAARGNYYDGATSALSIDSLTAGETLFFNQTDPDGKPLGAMPKILLVPNALNAKAAALMNSTEIRDTTASTKYGVSNPHAGKFTVARSTYLSSSAITGNSATAWYLLSDPNDIAVIEAAFLNGIETPTVESADADFNTLGIQMRGYHDFGVNKQEYRGGVKSKGAA